MLLRQLVVVPLEEWPVLWPVLLVMLLQKACLYLHCLKILLLRLPIPVYEATQAQ